MADAAYAIFTSDAKQVTGQYFIDEKVMRALGVKDFSKVRPTHPLAVPPASALTRRLMCHLCGTRLCSMP
jgi:citronellol/citronellal dehydrogenase